MVYTLLGTVGAILVLFGFYRTSIGQWTGKSLWYELDNFFGAIFITIYQWHYKVYISVILNIIWAFVAFRGISSYTERRLNGRAKRRKR
jgi:amino acid transporter